MAHSAGFDVGKVRANIELAKEAAEYIREAVLVKDDNEDHAGQVIAALDEALELLAGSPQPHEKLGEVVRVEYKSKDKLGKTLEWWAYAPGNLLVDKGKGSMQELSDLFPGVEMHEV